MDLFGLFYSNAGSWQFRGPAFIKVIIRASTPAEKFRGKKYYTCIRGIK
jgi:hypothetical protein